MGPLVETGVRTLLQEVRALRNRPGYSEQSRSALPFLSFVQMSDEAEIDAESVGWASNALICRLLPTSPVESGSPQDVSEWATGKLPFCLIATEYAMSKYKCITVKQSSEREEKSRSQH